MYRARYIERLGMGTADMVRVALAAGLREPEFVQTDEFKAIIYLPVSVSLPGKKQASNRQVPGKYQ
jgi:predicted HTH transcriptional regulator